MLAGWLPDREEGLSASQQLEATGERLPPPPPLLKLVVAALEPPAARDNGEDSGAQHRQANEPNAGQALRYNTKASAAAALPEAEGKKTKRTRQGVGGGESPPQSQNHFVCRMVALDLRAFLFLPSTRRE